MLIEGGEAAGNNSSAWFSFTWPSFQDLDPYTQTIAWPYRLDPAQVFKAKAKRTWGWTLRARVKHETHCKRCGMPAAGDQAAGDGLRGGGICMHRLRIKFNCESYDICLGDKMTSSFRGLSRRVILEIAKARVGLRADLVVHSMTISWRLCDCCPCWLVRLSCAGGFLIMKRTRIAGIVSSIINLKSSR